MQDLLIEKLCNAFVPNAVPSPSAGAETRAAADRFIKKHSGLWVAGKLTIAARELSFAPSDMSAALHDGLEPIRIPVSDIRTVRREFGWLTGIVVVGHANGEFRCRCFGARRVAHALASLASRYIVARP